MTTREGENRGKKRGETTQDPKWKHTTKSTRDTDFEQSCISKCPRDLVYLPLDLASRGVIVLRAARRDLSSQVDLLGSKLHQTNC